MILEEHLVLKENDLRDYHLQRHAGTGLRLHDRRDDLPRQISQFTGPGNPLGWGPILLGKRFKVGLLS